MLVAYLLRENCFEISLAHRCEQTFTRSRETRIYQNVQSACINVQKKIHSSTLITESNRRFWNRLWIKHFFHFVQKQLYAVYGIISCAFLWLIVHKRGINRTKECQRSVRLAVYRTEITCSNSHGIAPCDLEIFYSSSFLLFLFFSFPFERLS